MRKIILALLLLVSGYVMAQPPNYVPYASRNRYIALMADSTFHVPKGSTPSLRMGGYNASGALFYKTSDSSLYIYSGTQWRKFGQGGDSSIFATVYRADTLAQNIRGEISGLPAPTLQQVLATQSNNAIITANTDISPDASDRILNFGDAIFWAYVNIYTDSVISLYGGGSNILLNKDSLSIQPLGGNLKIDSLNSGASTDSILVWDQATGNVKKRNASAFGGGSGVTTIATINGTTKSANGAVISGSNLYMQTVDGTYPGLMTSAQKARLDSNSYLTIDKRYDSLAWRRNDSTFLVKSLRLQLNGSTITPTTTDSSLSYNILTTDTTTVPLITFSAGAGFAADTTLVTDSTLMGSLYTGQYEFTITKIQAVIKGNSGDSVVLMIVYNDSFNVLGTKVTNAGLSVSSRVFGNTFDVYTNRTVPANQWLWIKPQAVIAGKKPKYISVTLLGYKTYVAP